MLAGDARDSNSTRTESCVAIYGIPGAQTWLDAPKAMNCNGYHQIIHPSWGMRAGLKILGRRFNPVRVHLSPRTCRRAPGGSHG